MIDVLVRGGQVVTPAGIIQADVAVRGEKILAVGALDLPAQRLIEAQGSFVLPGLIDAHVHMGCAAWGAVSPNDFYRGTVAAALGGVTTIIDFATQQRGRPIKEAVEARRAEADGRVVVDYGLHVSITDASPATLHEIESVIAYGVPSFKMFMTYRSHNLMLDDGEMLDICREVAACGGLPGAHAENDAISERNYARFAAEGRHDPLSHALAKPDYVEAEAVNRALFLARVAGSPFYIYHLSTAKGVRLVEQCRAAGQPLLAETCIQYLTLTQEYLDRPDGVNYICSPPLRTLEDQEALWAALNKGTVAVVSTDEAGFNAADKQRVADGRLDQVPNGLPGVSVRLPVLFTKGVETGRLSLERFVEQNCSNPARIFGLYPRKGIVAPGSDADLIIIDPRHRVTLGPETQHMPTDWCAYEGMDVAGYPAYTLVRGRVVVDQYRFFGQAGQGQFLPGHIEPRYLEALW